MNHWLQREQDATPALHGMLKAAQALFSGWGARLESKDIPPAAATASAIADLFAACERLRSGDEPRATPGIAAESGFIEPAQVDDSIVIGELRLTPTVYDIFLTEARAHLAVLN